MTGAPAEDAEVAAAVRRSRLMRAGGFGVYRGIVDSELGALLRAEAEAGWLGARHAEVVEDAVAETRGGMPARRYLTAHGGPAQDAFYAAPWLCAILADATGVSFRPTGARGTYNYYLRPGDHLALHRDVRRCDLAVIAGLVAEDACGSGAGRLRLYPERIDEPLSAIRATPAQGAVEIWLGAGETLLLLGGLVPHALLPTGEGQRRIVSIMCFRAVGAT
jgi:hypothetical protein